MIEEGQEEFGGRTEERIPASGVVWNEAPESAIHSVLAGDVHAPPPPVCPAGAAPSREVARAAEEVGGAATSAEGVGEDDPGARPLVISSRARSSRTCRKVGKGL